MRRSDTKPDKNHPTRRETMNKPKFLMMDNGWYIWNDRGSTVMIPPSMSYMVRDGKPEDLTQKWIDRCLAL